MGGGGWLGGGGPLSVLSVLEVFDSLQGEGVWTGVPMTFVRLAGCNAPGLGLGCLDWCDTPESWDASRGVRSTPAEIASRVHLPRVCLTGGEPLLQAEGVAELVACLDARGVAVHVETNGTCPLPAGTAVAWVTVSPKPPDYLVAPALEGSVDELKVIVRAAGDPGAETIERLAARHLRAAVCLQPEAGSPGARQVAVDLVMAHPRWRLSLQLHKIVGVR